MSEPHLVRAGFGLRRPSSSLPAIRRPLALLLVLAAAGCRPAATPGSPAPPEVPAWPRYTVEPAVPIGSSIPDLPGGRLLEIGETFDLGGGEIAFWARVREGDDGWALLGYRARLWTIVAEGEASEAPHAAGHEDRLHVHRRSGRHLGTRVLAGLGSLVLTPWTTSIASRGAGVYVWDGRALRRWAGVGDRLGNTAGEEPLTSIAAQGVGADGTVLASFRRGTRFAEDGLALVDGAGVRILVSSGAPVPGLDRRLARARLFDPAAATDVSIDGAAALVALAAPPRPPAPPRDPTRPPDPTRSGPGLPPSSAGATPTGPGGIPFAPNRPPRGPGAVPRSMQAPPEADDRAFLLMTPTGTRRLLAPGDPDPTGAGGPLRDAYPVLVHSADTFVAIVWRTTDAPNFKGEPLFCRGGACALLEPPTLAPAIAAALDGRAVQLRGEPAPAPLAGPVTIEILDRARIPGLLVDPERPLYLFTATYEVTAGTRRGTRTDVLLFDGRRTRVLGPLPPYLDRHAVVFRRVEGPRPGVLVRGGVGGQLAPEGFPPILPPIPIGSWFLDLADLGSGLVSDPVLATDAGAEVRLGDVVGWRPNRVGVAATPAGLVLLRPVAPPPS